MTSVPLTVEWIGEVNSKYKANLTILHNVQDVM